MPATLAMIDDPKVHVERWLWWAGATAALMLLCRKVSAFFVRVWHGLQFPFVTLRNLGDAVERLAKAVSELEHSTRGQFSLLTDRLETLHNALTVIRRQTRIVHEASKTGMFECELPSGECVWVNGSLAKLFGMESEQMHGWGWLAVVHPDDRKRVRDQWLEAVTSRLPYAARYRIIVNDAPLTVECKAEVIYSDAGLPLSAVGTVAPLPILKE